MISRRAFVGGAALSFAAPSVLRAQTARTLKISHQFPGGTIDQGDFRDRLCRKFAAGVEERTGGALKFEIYPGSSLMKTNAQFSALRKGALDFSLYPLAYAGGEVPAMNLGLMPCLVTTYEQGAKWKDASSANLCRASPRRRASNSSAGYGRRAALLQRGNQGSR